MGSVESIRSPVKSLKGPIRRKTIHYDNGRDRTNPFSDNISYMKTLDQTQRKHKTITHQPNNLMMSPKKKEELELPVEITGIRDLQMRTISNLKRIKGIISPLPSKEVATLEEFTGINEVRRNNYLLTLPHSKTLHPPLERDSINNSKRGLLLEMDNSFLKTE